MGGTGHRGEEGLGGTGHGTDGSGFGGTGLFGEGGMGGTGRRAEGSGMGGTGVVGIITGFGSIRVNGLDLRYSSSTTVTQDGEPVTTGVPALGQVVAVEAEGTGITPRARRIALQSAVVGPVTWMSPRHDALTVLGQNIRLPRDGFRPGLSLKVGGFARVSGLREPGGAVLATRIAKLPAGGNVSVAGTVDAVSGNTMQLAGLAIETGKPSPPGISLRATGRMEQGVLRARRILVEPELAFTGQVDRLVLHGIAQGVGTGREISLG